MSREQAIIRINKVFQDDSIVVMDSTTAKDIEDWDSLAHLQLMAEIEKEFNIYFTLREITNFANVSEMCNSVIKHWGVMA